MARGLNPISYFELLFIGTINKMHEGGDVKQKLAELKNRRAVESPPVVHFAAVGRV